MLTAPPPAARLPHPYRDESEVLAGLLAPLQGALDWAGAAAQAGREQVKSSTAWVSSASARAQSPCHSSTTPYSARQNASM